MVPSVVKNRSSEKVLKKGCKKGSARHARKRVVGAVGPLKKTRKHRSPRSLRHTDMASNTPCVSISTVPVADIHIYIYIYMYVSYIIYNI